MPDARRRAEPGTSTRLRRRRRRRAVSLGTVGVLASLAFGLGLWSGAAGSPDAEAGSTVPAATEQPAVPSPTTRRAVRLGSGRSVTLAFAGDVHFESPIRERLEAAPASVLAPMAPVLRRADVAMVNLETAVTERGEPADKEFVFRAPATAFEALRAGGVDVATVANNHGMDYGPVGLRDTLVAAKRSRVPVVGAGWNDTQAYAPYRVTVKGQRIAIIGATQVLDDHLIRAWSAGPGKLGLASAKNVPRLVRAVREARATSDTVVVYLHWGLELSSCPTAQQRSLADRLAAAGADVVVGSHAHVLLGAGRKRGMLVAYGLGNFVFYAFRPSTTTSGVLEVTVTGRRVDSYGWVPARISSGIPSPLSRSARSDAVSSWRSLRTCTDLRR